MTRCQHCKKKCAMPMECKQCQIQLCVKCYRPEAHKCEKLEHFIRLKKLDHIKNLESSKCVSTKMEKI